MTLAETRRRRGGTEEDRYLITPSRHPSRGFILAKAHYGPGKMSYPSAALRRGPESRHLHAWRAASFAYRGRGAASLLPALRTVRAVLPHTALRSVVIYIEIGVQERELARG